MVWKINESSDFSGIGKAKVANPSPADIKNANAVAEQASAVDSNATTSAASGGIGTLLVGTSGYIGRGSGIVAGTNADDPLNNGKLQFGLLGIFLEAQNAVKSLSGAARAQAMADFIGSNTLATIHEGYIAIDVAATNGDGASILDDLAAIGLIRGAAFGASAGGLLPLDAIDNLAALDTVKFARPAYAMTNTGSVTGQDDLAIDAPAARVTYGVDGTGLTVGILSDSFDTYSGSIKYAQDIASGDLPNDVSILADSAGGSDEGRAMAQLVYDIAPGADLAFHTAFVSMADFAQGILDLRDAGSDIIVDDVTYFAEPMFQDGILSQAINTVVADGAMYFTSAGNGADLSYESAWRASGQTFTSGGDSWALFDFDPGAGIDTRLSISLTSTSIFIFQWDEAFFSVSGGAGAQTDLDLLFFNSSGGLVGVVGANNIGGDALELAQLGSGNYSVAFGKYLTAGATDDPNFVKMIINGSGTINEFATNSSTSYGHPDAAGAISVGAAGFDDTPAFGQTPPRAENFTSKGGTTLLFNEEGERYISPITRGVDFTAPDGSNTTFFFNDTSRDADSLPNFFGTSAAAPNAAALAALMMQHDPTASLARIEKALADSAIDILTLRNNSNVGAGFDAHTGAGLIQASAAFAALDDDAGPLLSVFRQTTYVDSDVDGLVDPGNVLHTTVLITNNGVDAAINVVLADSAPGTTLDFSSVKVNGATVAPAVDGSIALGDLAVDASVTVTFDLLTTSQVVVGPYTQQANVTADSGVTATSNTETLTFDTANTLSLGNVIFNDADENGLFGNGDAGIAGVALTLYADANNDNVADGGGIASTTTGTGGSYLFANLAPGNYILGVDASNFSDGGVLEGFSVTTNAGDPDNNVNNDSNGADAGVNGVRSASITLSVGGEPTTDGDSDTNTNLTLDIGFYNGNNAPVAGDDSIEVSEDFGMVYAARGLLANDSDADNDPITAILVTGAAHGTATINSDGSFSYVSDENYHGTDSFTYKVSDGELESNVATVTVTVNPANDAPSGADNSIFLLGVSRYAFSAEDFGFSDPIDGNSGAESNIFDGVIISTIASDGTLYRDTDGVGGSIGTAVTALDVFTASDITSGFLVFVPDAGETGSPYATFTFQVMDDGADGPPWINQNTDPTPKTMTIIVADDNAAPVAVDDNYSVDEDGTLTVLAAAGLLANDTDADMDTLTPLLTSGPVNGNLTVNLDGSFVYTPGSNYNGTVSFTYRANDGFTTGNLATVTITINSVNDAPEITSNGGDATAEISIAENSTAVTTVTATDVDGGPVMMAEAVPTGLAGTKGANAAPQADPLGITYSIVSFGDGALFTINPDTGALSFITAPDFESPADDDFSNVYAVRVRATDNGGLFDEQTLSVVVTNVNDAPVLTIAASQPVYDQNQAVVSFDSYNISTSVLAESFTLTSATTLSLFEALLEDNGFAEDDSFDEFGGTLSWAIYAADPGGGPGTLLFTGNDANPILTDTGLLSGFDNDIFNAKISLGAVSLAAGDYWIALHEGEWLSPYDNSPIYWINSGNDPDPASPAALAIDETNPVYEAVDTTLAFRLSEALPGLAATEQVPLDLAGLIRVTDQDAGIGELVVRIAVTYGVLAISAGATGAAVTGSGTGSVTVTGTLAELEALLQGTEGATLTYTANTEDPQLSTALIVTVDDQGNTGSGGAQTDAGSIVINITPVDDAPVISSNEGGDTAAISIAENTTAVTTVVATDPEGATVTYSITGGADSALFDIDEETGALIFLAAPDFETPADDGTDNVYDVIVTASAGALADTQAIAVTVTNVNETPVNTLPATFSGTEDTTLALTGISVSDVDAGNGTVQVTFQAPGCALTVATDVAGGLTAGQVANNGSDTIIISGTIAEINATLAATDGFTIAPPADFNGDKTLTMFIIDGGSTGSGGQKSDIDTTTITFAPVADAPVITSNGGGDTAAISVAEDATAVTTVVATDADGDTLGYSITGGADAALFDIDEDTGALTFITAPNFEAPADAGGNNVYDVIVTASDGTLSDSQAIAVTILDGPDNAAPVSVNDAYNANEDVTLNVSAASGVLANDTDANDDALTAILVTGPAHGTLTLNADGSFSYRGSANYNGPDSFTYKTNDGEIVGNTATVSLNVRSVNDAPVLAVPIADQTSPEDDAWTFVVPAGTFTDIDTAVLTLSATLDDGSPLPSWLSFDPATRTFSGTPPQDFNGSYDITVTASDGVNTVSDTFELDITPVFDPPVNTPPEAANDTALTVRNTPVSFDASLLLVNDVDPQGDRLTITGVTNGTRGSVVLNGTTVTFTPEAGYTGTATFTYRVVDTSGASDTATVTVSVIAPANSRPVVSPALENLTTFEGTAVSIMVEATDADGDALTYTVSGDAHGELTGGTGGAFLYTPDDGFVGTDSVIITVSDGKGGTAQYEATITVLDFGAPEEFRLLAVDGWAGEIGGNGTVFGTEGFQDITVLDVAGYISFDPSFNAGNDIIRLSGDAADWDIVRFGSSAILSDGDTVVTLPVGVVGQPIVFDDGARSLVFDTESGSMFIGDQLFTTTFVAITADSDGSVLPGTADDEAVARIQLNEGGDVHAGGTIDVFGTDQAEDLFLTYGAITLDPSFNKGGDTLTLDGDASDFSAVLVGSNVVLDGNGYIVSIPAGPAGIDIVFDDGTRELLFDTVAEVVLIDSQVITLTVTPLSDIG